MCSKYFRYWGRFDKSDEVFVFREFISECVCMCGVLVVIWFFLR